MSTTETGAHYFEETVEPTQRALTLHLLQTHFKNLNSFVETKTKFVKKRITAPEQGFRFHFCEVGGLVIIHKKS